MLPEEAHWLATTITNCPRAEQILLNRLAKSIMYCVVTIYITLHYITLHFWAFLRFFSGIHIFSRLYNLPPRQAFSSSRRPDSLAITAIPKIFNWIWSIYFGNSFDNCHFDLIEIKWAMYFVWGSSLPGWSKTRRYFRGGASTKAGTKYCSNQISV